MSNLHYTLSLVLVGIVSCTQACATTTTTTSTSTMGTELSVGVRQGRVEWIRETVQRTEGDPALGAVAGAVIGGVLGGLITGHRGGSVVGAATGAIIGASESQEDREDRSYEIFVRFDDGDNKIFRYWGYPPFQPGQAVMLTERGLIGRQHFVSAPTPEPSPTPSQAASITSETTPSSAQPDNPPPPPPPRSDAPRSTIARPSVPAGQWAYTQQYGWLWMPYGVAYTFSSHYENGDPYMYVYYPRLGWSWVEAPWLWGWGPRPYLGSRSAVRFNWYGPGWGTRWTGGHRPLHYRRGPLGRRR